MFTGIYLAYAWGPKWHYHSRVAHSAGAAAYTDWFSAEG